jgi:hypothetical protein
MTADEAGRVIAALRSGRVFELSNSAYGKWSLAFDVQRGQFKYHSEFWGDDPENPRIDDDWLSEADVVQKLSGYQYTYDPHFARFVGDRN